ncbi:MAG: hypothetical protein UR39_C0005G0009 [Candidatus Woesebacteria bacterium GW2011_GWA1_33_30]|uniref:DUF5673 domain-containing protein n=1 Tax=Candidatus Woesebacteria bacterium GW2011_GWA2_33_28 TaxID=1618561 RepID=A0A0G0A7E8_9BACT|nr:MAG: hypothetical protein UR38_C0005G0009 [Candidatus Woesebacteria bacterium GW2011_GWA2_33_28]KKP48127.1 MAG: hypothetical protein UR39_C0005G0009 [Candidatus Woesebacteria bacterium GW2011_GWA1_33_30]KKP49369.1 MAG: hypothetical protein UR40_C0006G0009 [Microgenomates group bacterium GW2011_GWC1_33_32]KKP52095.1 MAG: hypothetical protein UR44_C0004G0009 [Candidatus Woesebacteria bacterium GW2011_GWB1_33_38]
MDPAKEQQQENSSLKPELEKDLVTWVAPARPFKRRDKQFYLTTISIAGIVCLILFLAEGAMPVILIVSLIFLYYVMSTVAPEDIEYKITNKGIKVGGRTTNWQFLGRFWFGKRYDSELLIVETAFIPNRMELVIKSEVKEEIKENLKKYLIEEEISPSKLDKAIDWFSKKLPN